MDFNPPFTISAVHETLSLCYIDHYGHNSKCGVSGMIEWAHVCKYLHILMYEKDLVLSQSLTKLSQSERKKISLVGSLSSINTLTPDSQTPNWRFLRCFMKF